MPPGRRSAITPGALGGGRTSVDTSALSPVVEHPKSPAAFPAQETTTPVIPVSNEVSQPQTEAPPRQPQTASPTAGPPAEGSFDQFLANSLASLREKLHAEINTTLSSITAQSKNLGQSNSFGKQLAMAITPFDHMAKNAGNGLLPGQVITMQDSSPMNSPQLRMAASPSGPAMATRSSLKELRGDDAAADFCKALFKKIDVDNSGDVTKTEFLRAFKTDDVVIDFCRSNEKLRPLLNFKCFKAAFQAIDLDASNSVSLEEFRVAIDKLMENEAIKEDTEEGEHQVHDRGGFKKMELKKEALDEEVYDVQKFYNETGCSQKIARSDYFQNFTLAVICVNAIYIGLDIQYNEADSLMDADPFFILMEILFCVYFVFEIFVRFGAFKQKRNCLWDNWFKFDSVLVVLMVLETCLFPFVFGSGDGAPPTGVLRLLRLLRLSRMVRLMRSVPELVTIMKGIYVAVRAVLSTFVMVILMIYIFAILLFIVMKDDICPVESGGACTSDYFSTLGFSMFTLYAQGILGDSPGAFMLLLIEAGWEGTLALIIFFIFVMLTSITVMNLLVGVLVDVVSTVAEDEKELAETNLVKEQILSELKQFDDGDGEISEEELNEVMIDPKSVAVLEAIGVDVQFLQTLQVMHYEDPEATVSITDILDSMLMCRRQSPVTMKHLIVQQHLTIWMITNKIMQHERRMDSKLDARFELLLPPEDAKNFQNGLTSMHQAAMLGASAVQKQMPKFLQRRR